MAELTARPDSWLDYLPGNWQQAVNTSPLLNTLAKLAQRPTPDMTRGIEHDQYGSVSDRNWLLEAARGGPPKLNPLAAEMIDKGGLLANFLAPGVKLPAAAPKPTGIRAYHGSPHDFDKFDISKIGTGEGAQAYGRGLYFAEKEAVARDYRDRLGGSLPSKFDTEQEAIAAAGQGGRVQKFVTGGFGAINRKGEYVKQDPGRMYEVRINADPEQFLDWDKPLSQQPEAVRKVTAQLEKMGLGDIADRTRSTDTWAIDATALARQYPTALREAGIPGIKYLDQQSRVAGQGSRNYVVFDDKLIEILRKYGLLPPVAAGTAAALNQEQPQQ